MVAWEKVMRPLELGGLGIYNLEVMGWALQMRWLCIEKSQPGSRVGWSKNPCSHEHLSHICHLNCDFCWKRRQYSILVGPLASWLLFRGLST